MKTLIVYASKYGFAKECAEELKGELKGDVTIIDAVKGNLPAIDKYDNVIAGGSIYMGQINKKLKEFINTNLDKLLDKNLGLFLGCGFLDKYEETLAAVFPKELIDSAAATQCFGGEMNMDKMSFLHKKISQMLEKQVDISKIKKMPENIKKMASKFN